MNAIELGRMSRRLDLKHRQRPLKRLITNSGMSGPSLVSLFESVILVERRVVLVYLPILRITAVHVLGGSLWPATKRLLLATC
jgi:hypothetical protein